MSSSKHPNDREGRNFRGWERSFFEEFHSFSLIKKVIWYVWWTEMGISFGVKDGPIQYKWMDGNDKILNIGWRSWES